MPNRRVSEFYLPASTLAELRNMMETLADYPETALIRVRTGFSANRHGSAIKTVVVIERPDSLP